MICVAPPDGFAAGTAERSGTSRDRHLEKRDLTLGLVPLNDCAPIAVGVEKGFFTKHGLNVTTTRESSWAGIRDKVAYGVLDAAQMLATMPVCSTLGVGGFQCDMVYGVTLGLNGNAITLANPLCDAIEARGGVLGGDAMDTADGLAGVIRAGRGAGAAPLRLGVVFPMSTHDLELRYWLAAAGIDPQADVELVVVPPPRMVEAIRGGDLSGFCVGEPWNSLAVSEGLGRVVMTKHGLWNNSVEKVLGVTADWAEKHPRTHVALIAALIEACRWLDVAEHRAEACEILSLPQYVGVAAPVIARSMSDRFCVARDNEPIVLPDFHVFHRYQANMPWRSQALWLLMQMQRWGQVATPYEAQLALGRVVRDDLYVEAARELGLAVPSVAEKREGEHAGPWTLATGASELRMGADRFFDGAVFDPAVIDLRRLPNPSVQGPAAMRRGGT